MFTSIYQWTMSIEALFWGYIAFSMIIFLGCFLTFHTRFFQLRAIPSILNTFWEFLAQPSTETRGIHPLRAFFASVGGMIGVGNIVGIVTAVQMGGPGALLWIWIAAILGSIIKYSEIYLGLKHRVSNSQNGYDGGPMIFLKKAFSCRWLPALVCVLLCIYAAEIFQFSVVVETISTNWNIQRFLVVPIMLGLILYAASGGVSRVSKICTFLMPIFMLVYMGMCLWVLGHHIPELSGLLHTVVSSAFTGHAAIGGFAGSTVMLAVQNGMAGACYSADIGIGYDSIIQSESRAQHPERQAKIAILGVFVDNFICTLSVMVVLVTGLWHTSLQTDGQILVQTALAAHFPGMEFVMPLFIFVLAYTTLISYYSVGLKCAHFLDNIRGKRIYTVYSVLAFIFFSFFDQTVALFVMRIAGALLLVINLTAIYRLRHEISFSLGNEQRVLIGGEV